MSVMRFASLEDRRRAAEKRDALTVLVESWPFDWTPPGRDPQTLPEVELAELRLAVEGLLWA